MIVLAPLFLASLALADTVLIHPGDEDLCIRADAPREREQLSQGRCSTSDDDVRKWDIDETSPTLIRLHGSDVCLTGGVHRTWNGDLRFDPGDGDHVVLRACPDGPRLPNGYAWLRHEGEHGLSFKLDVAGDTWYLDSSSGAAPWIAKNDEPQHGWTLEKVHDDDDGDDDGDEEGEGIEFWEAVGDVLGHAV